MLNNSIIAEKFSSSSLFKAAHGADADRCVQMIAVRVRLMRSGIINGILTQQPFCFSNCSFGAKFFENFQYASGLHIEY